MDGKRKKGNEVTDNCRAAVGQESRVEEGGGTRSRRKTRETKTSLGMYSENGRAATREGLNGSSGENDRPAEPSRVASRRFASRVN